MVNLVTAANIAKHTPPAAVALWAEKQELYPVERDLIQLCFPPPPARVLDIGCGAGRTTLELVQMGYSVTAIDLSDELLNVARTRVPLAKTLKMDATHLQFPDKSFDAVFFSFNGLDYIYPSADRYKVFSEVRRVLVDGGTFYYSGHNAVGSCGRNSLLGVRRGWLTTAKFLWHQRRNRHIFEGYFSYMGSNGSQLFYSGTPGSHLKTMEKMGFIIKCVRGVKRMRDNNSVTLALNPEVATRGEIRDELAAVRPGLRNSLVGIERLTLFYPHVQYIASCQV